MIEEIKTMPEKVTKTTKKAAKKIEQTVVDQKDTLVQKSALGVATVLTVTAAANAGGAPAAKGIETVSNENTISLTDEGSTIADSPSIVKADGKDAKVPATPMGSLLNLLKDAGKSMVTRQLSTWGLEALGAIFQACGLNIMGGGEDSYVQYFAEINAKLDDIQKTLDDIQTQVTQNEDARIIDGFYKDFNAIKASIDPVLTGLADIADREAKASPKEKEAILAEKVAFYNNHVRPLSPGTSFSEKVVALANLAAAPSSNLQNTLMKCFNSVTFDVHGIYTWDVQRYETQEDFLGYVASTLLKAASVARYEISYQLSIAASPSDKAYWTSADQNLCAALDKALDVLQKDTKDVLKHANNIRNGIFTHVATGISLNKRLGTTSFDPKVGHNVLAYGDFDKALDHTKAFYLHLLVGEQDAFYEALMKEYKLYLKSVGLTNDKLSFIEYLDRIGFVINGDISSYTGVFWKMKYKLEKYIPDHIDAVHINKRGERAEKDGRCGYLDWDIGWVKKIKYHNGKGYSNKYLVFLQPGSNYVLGSYTRRLLCEENNGRYKQVQKYPNTSYAEASEKGLVGYCDPSWE